MEDPNNTGVTGPSLMSVPDFAAKIKEQYPVYESLEDTALVEAMLEKYPVYQDRVDYSPVKKKDDGQLDSALVPTSVVPTSVPVIGRTTSEEEPEYEEPGFFTGDLAFIGDLPLGDFVDDLLYNVRSGYRQGMSSSEALDLFMMGSDVSDEDLDEFMQAYGLAQNTQPTEEMISFQEDAADAGGGFWGTIYAGVKNPSAAFQMMTSSMSQIANPKAATLGLPVLAGTGGAGAPFAFAIAGGVTETGAVFQELLVEELGDEEMNKENLRSILQDEEAVRRMRITAGKKGVSTAVIDAIFGGAASRAGATIIRGGQGAVSRGRRLAQIAVTQEVEGLGGIASEAGGQLIAYGEVTPSEVAEEYIGGKGGTAPAMIRTSYKVPKYTYNGQRLSRPELLDQLDGMTIQEIEGLIDDGTIKVKNDDQFVNWVRAQKNEKPQSTSSLGTSEDKKEEDEKQRKLKEEYEAASEEYSAATDEYLETLGKDATTEEYEAAKQKYQKAKDRMDAAFEAVFPTEEQQSTPTPDETKGPESEPTPEPAAEPTEAEQKLSEAKAKLEQLSNTEAAAAERRTKALEEKGSLEDAQDLQERINRLQDKLDGGVTKKGKRFTKKGKEGLQKQIDNRTAELKALYEDAGIQEDVATILSSSRERAKAQNEVNALQEQVDSETKKSTEEKKTSDKAEALPDLEQKRKSLQQRVVEMKAERKKLEQGKMGDSPQAKQLNKDIAVAEREVGNLNVQIQQAKQAQKQQTKSSVTDKLKRFGLDGDLRKPAKQIIVNGTEVDVESNEQKFSRFFQVGSLLNHPVVMYGFGRAGQKGVKGPMRGFLRVEDGGDVRFVSHDGRKIYELGNINEGLDLDGKATDLFLTMDNDATPAITSTDQVVVEGKAYRLAVSKPGFGIERYKNNNIKEMIVIDEDGNEVVLVSNGRLKPSNKPATGFTAEVNQWAQDREKRLKGESKSPDIVREEQADQEVAEPTPPEQPPTPPEDTDTEPQPDQPEGEPTPTLDPEERQRKLEEEGVYGSTWMSRNMPMVDRWRRNTLSSRGFFPKSVQALREMRDGRMNLHARKAEKTAKDFMKIWKRMSKAMPEDQQRTVMNAMDRLLRGEKVDLTASGIPADMVLVIARMRQHIDSMSQDMLDRGLIPDKNAIDPVTGERVTSRENIENNIGKYVSRTYELFEGKDWSKRVTQETKNEAIGYFKEQVAKDEKLNEQFTEWAAAQKEKDPKKLLHDFAAKQVENILLKDADSLSQFGPQDAPNRSPLLQRQDLDPRLRALFGERTNPMTNYIVTAARLGQLAEKSRYLAEVKEMGLKMGWLSEGTTDVGVEGYEASLEIDGVPPELNPLQGMRTHPDIAKAFKEQPNWFDRNIAGNTFGKLFGIAKWNKTVGSATTHARNVIGNTSFVVANGHLSKDAAGISLRELFQPSEQGYNRLMELGVIGQASNRQEITELMNAGTVLDALEQRFSKKGSPFQEFAKKAYEATAGKAANVADKLYLAEDDFFKIYGFEIEKNRYAKALYNTDFNSLTDEQKVAVEERSAAIIKNVYPNYNRIGPLIKGISKMPAVGTFLAFRAESFRVSFNIMRLAFEEMQDPATRSIGAKRMAGIGTYLSGKAALQASSAAGSGYGLLSLLGGTGKQEDDEDKKGTHRSDFDDLAYFVRPWEKYGYQFRELGYKENVISDQLIVTDIDRENGIVKYRNMSTVDGFSDPTAVFQRVMAGLQGKGQISDNRLVDAFAGGLVELVGPFVEEEMTTGMLNQFTNNQKATGAPIWNPEDDVERQMMDVYEHFFKLFPSVFEQSIKLAEGGYGDTPAEAFLGVIGLGELTVDVREQMQRGVIPEFNERLQRNDKIRWKAEDYEGDESAASYNAMVQEKTERDKDVMRELVDYTQAAMNLGVKERDIREDLGRLKFPSKIFMNDSPSAFSAIDLILAGDKSFIDQITPNYDRDYKGPTPE